MGVFATKEAELCAYMAHNGWGLEDLVALNMLYKKGFKSEEAAQLMLVSRRTRLPIESVMGPVMVQRLTDSLNKMNNAMRGFQK